MIKITFEQKIDSSCKILCLGAHCDDIEIGCGGTILRLLEHNSKSSVHWTVFSSNELTEKEAEKSANLFLERAKYKDIVMKQFQDSFFPFIGGEIKKDFEQLKRDFSPDIIFTHYRNDLHQDHRLISDLTWQTFRDHLILEYEVPKYDGDLGSPSFFVNLKEDFCQKKIDFILSSFKSQSENHWFSKETFVSLLKLRGNESNSPFGYAEGFYCRKIVF